MSEVIDQNVSVCHFVRNSIFHTGKMKKMKNHRKNAHSVEEKKAVFDGLTYT